VSYGSAIAACATAGQWHTAVGLVRAMASKGIPPGVINYNAAIRFAT
jgi:pentatricopeptide repeat protein